MHDLSQTGLSEAVISALQKAFRHYPEIDLVKLYGSRAKGNYHNGSDIDLSIAQTNQPFTQLEKLQTELDDLMLPYGIDLNVFSELTNQDLIAHIQRVGIEIYKK